MQEVSGMAKCNAAIGECCAELRKDRHDPSERDCRLYEREPKDTMDSRTEDPLVATRLLTPSPSRFLCVVVVNPDIEETKGMATSKFGAFKT